MTKRAYIRMVIMYAFYLLLAFAIQSAWPTASMASVVKPNFLLILAVISAYQFGFTDAIAIGLLGGFLLDYMAGRLIGVGMLIFLFAALIATELFRKNLTRSFLPAILTTAICTLFYELSVRAFIWLSLITGDGDASRIVFIDHIGDIVQAILYNIAIMLPIFLLIRYLGPYKRSIGFGHVQREGDESRW